MILILRRGIVLLMLYTLKKGVNQSCKITVEFRTDVFTYPFKALERTSLHHPILAHFPQDWFKMHDRFGDGCEMNFPIRMCSSIKWSPTV